MGGLFEVSFTTSARFVDGFRILPWAAVLLLGMTLSMGMFEYAGRTIPPGTAYAVWASIGAAGTAVAGMTVFSEPVSPARLLLLAGLIGCIIGLKLVRV